MFVNKNYANRSSNGAFYMKTASTFKQSGKTFLETGSLCEFLGKKNTCV
jgi:hypothetical protein